MMRCRKEQSNSHIRRFRPQLENLEPKQLLAGDSFEPLPDYFDVRQAEAPHQLDVLINDIAGPGYGGAAKITSVSFGNQGGQIAVSATGSSLTYTPSADFQGLETFTYYVDEQFSAEVSINVQSPLRDDFFNFQPGVQTRTLPVLDNDPFWLDYQGDQRITLVSQSDFGVRVDVSDDGRSLLYDLPQHQYGMDSIIYMVDGRYTATVDILLQAPLEKDRFEIVQNTSDQRLDVLSNDPFWSGYNGPRRVTRILDLEDGDEATISDDGRSLLFTPMAQKPGTRVIRYVVDDRFESSAQIYVQQPVQSDWVEVDSNSSNFVIDVLSNDHYYSVFSKSYVDVVDRVTFVGASEQGGQTSIAADGTVHYTAPTGFVGDDTFTYVADGQHHATVTVHVTAPVRNDYFSVAEFRTDRLDVLGNDFQGNGYGGQRHITQLSETTSGGAVSLEPDGNVLYRPPADFLGSDSFKYEVDGQFQSTVHISVIPIATDDSYVLDSADLAILDPLTNDHFDTAYDGPGIITSVTPADNGGTVNIAADGRTLTYQPGMGRTTFEYTVDEKFTGQISVSSPRRLADDHAAVDQNSGANPIDVLENDFQNTYIQQKYGPYTGAGRITHVSETAQGGIVTISPDGLVVEYQPPADFQGNDSFDYFVDGILQSTVNVDVIRRVRDDVYRVAPNSSNNELPATVNDLFGADYTGAGVITDVTDSPSGALVAIAPDGKSLLYTPATGFHGTETVTYTVDGKLLAEVHISVHAAAEDILPRFESTAALKDHLLAEALDRYFSDSAIPYYVDLVETHDAGSPRTSQTFGRPHSETNVQVAGVDEADIVENDGEFLYVVSGSDLVIARAWPAAEMDVLSQTTLSGMPIGAFLAGDRLTIVASIGDFAPSFDLVDESFRGMAIDDSWYFNRQDTLVTVFDVTDRSSPQLVQETRLDGSYVESRRIDDFVYVVAQQGNISLPSPYAACRALDPDCASALTREQYVAWVDESYESIIEEILPHYTSLGPDGDVVRSGLLTSAEDIFRPLYEDASQLLTVASFNMASSNPGIAATEGVMTTGGTHVHGTRESLYVLDSRFRYDSEDGTNTNILRFAWDAQHGTIQLVSNGSLAGRVNDQFAVDEYGGLLRVVTNVSNSGSGNFTGNAESMLFVLQDDAGTLEIVAGLQNLSPGESLESVRFNGDSAFVVTRRQVDPLIHIDLSVPDQPVVSGQLSLPGFSSYMQFVDEDHILTIGQNSANTRSGATAISLFDVSDRTTPQLIDQEMLPVSANSLAANDHHAFGWFAHHNLLSVPSARYFSERVDADGDGYAEFNQPLTEHQMYNYSVDVTASSGENLTLSSEVTHDSQLLRAAFIGDVLYSVAEGALQAIHIDNPTETAGVVTWESHSVSLHAWARIGHEQLEQLATARSAAVYDLAHRLGVEEQRIMAVTMEPIAGASSDTQIVLNSDGMNYLYSASDEGDVTFVRQGFDFAAPATGRHHAENPLDVNADDDISPLDALLVVNGINTGNRDVLRPIRGVGTDNFLDANNDGWVSPIDALLVINELNNQPVQAASSSLAAEFEPASEPATPIAWVAGFPQFAQPQAATAARSYDLLDAIFAEQDQED